MLSPPLYMISKHKVSECEGPPNDSVLTNLYTMENKCLLSNKIGHMAHVYVRLHNVLLWGGSWGGYGLVE